MWHTVAATHLQPLQSYCLRCLIEQNHSSMFLWGGSMFIYKNQIHVIVVETYVLERDSTKPNELVLVKMKTSFCDLDIYLAVNGMM